MTEKKQLTRNEIIELIGNVIMYSHITDDPEDGAKKVLQELEKAGVLMLVEEARNINDYKAEFEEWLNNYYEHTPDSKPDLSPFIPSAYGD